MSSKGCNPYVTVADDVSPLYLLTLLKKTARRDIRTRENGGGGVTDIGCEEVRENAALTHICMIVGRNN